MIVFDLEIDEASTVRVEKKELKLQRLIGVLQLSLNLLTEK